MTEDGLMNATAEVYDFLTGGLVDTREVVAKNNPDSSALSVQSPIKLKKLSAAETKKRQKRQAQVGLASNVLGITAGAAALGSAARDDRFGAKGAPGWARAVNRAGKKIPAPIANISRKSPKVAAGMAAGAVGLQAANLGGDLVANRVLSREAKKDIKKAYEEVIKAYREGRITREQYDDIAKVSSEVIYLANTVRAAGSNKTVQQMAASTYKGGKRRTLKAMPHNKKKARIAAQKTAEEVEAKHIPRLRRNGLIASATGIGGTGFVAGHYSGKRKARREAAWTGQISKVDEEKRQVFGWASLSSIDGEPVVDRQLDWVPIEETEKSAYAYMLDSRKGGDMHKRVKKDWRLDEPLHTADIIESFVVTPEKLVAMGLDENALPHGWWVGFKVHDDEQWEKVKKGERTGFSIHGAGRRKELV